MGIQEDLESAYGAKIPIIGVFRHEHKDTDRYKDSLEFGPANCRIKVYVDAANMNEAQELIANAVSLAQDGRKLMADAGLDPKKEAKA